MGWDAIIVGARCAGSPLAQLLARAGKRVLLVDSASFPSDQPMSTHVIQPYGMRVLDELGVGDRVREIAPPTMLVAQSVDEEEVRLELPLGVSCPRRIDLDHVLLEAARNAGAEVRLQHRVVDVIRERERVVGVVAEDRDGAKHELRARVVVGADGRNSTIGDLVGAEKYFEQSNPRAFYWAYYPRPAWYGEPPYDNVVLIAIEGRDLRLVFPVNRDQLLLGVGCPVAEVPRWKSDPRAMLEASLRERPFFAKLVSEPLSKTLGLVKAEYFFRRAAGPGWALVGDAGLHKDPTAGFGITDALRDARNLAAAILADSDAALDRYWRQRDVDSIPLYCYAQDLGGLEFANPLNKLVYTKLRASKELQDRCVLTLERTLSPFELIKPGEILRWTLGALVRGKFGVLGPFLRAARRGAFVESELKRRRKLLTPALPAADAKPVFA